MQGKNSADDSFKDFFLLLLGNMLWHSMQIASYTFQRSNQINCKSFKEFILSYIFFISDDILMKNWPGRIVEDASFHLQYLVLWQDVTSAQPNQQR